MKISLQRKLLILIGTLLSLSFVAFFGISYQFFKSDKNTFIFESQQLKINRVKQELSNAWRGLEEKSALFAALSVRSQNDLMSELIRQDSHIIYVGSRDIADFAKNEKLNDKQLNQFSEIRDLAVHPSVIKNKTIGLHRIKEQLRSDLVKSNFDFLKEIQQEKTLVWRFDSSVKRKTSTKEADTSKPKNDTIKQNDNRSLLVFARLIENKKAIGQTVLFAVLDFEDLDQWLMDLSDSQLAVFNQKGDLLLGQGPISEAHKFLLNSVAVSKNTNSVLSFDVGSEKYFGGFDRMNSQVSILSSTLESTAFKSLTVLRERILIISTMIMTFAVLMTVLFARSLTEPLHSLVDRMRKASKGDLSSQVLVRSNDEIKELGESFQSMMTDLKNSRDQLEEINRSLEDKVRERTVELEKQNQLVKETQEALLRTTRLASAGEVAGRAAHEVLNPLTSLLARAEVAEKRVQQEGSDIITLMSEITSAWENDYKNGGFDSLLKNWSGPSSLHSEMNLFQEDLANFQGINEALVETSKTTVNDILFIKKEGQRIIKIVNGMRKLSQPKSDSRPWSLHSLIEDARLIMKDLYSARGFPLIIECRAENDNILIDKDEFLQAITNMMRNSLQSLVEAGSEKGYLKISTVNFEENINLFIEDSGVGIEPINQIKLFEKQFSTKNSDEGTGLGLSISRRLIRSHNGDIEFVESIPQVKTVFKMRFPLAKKVEGAAA